MDFSREPPDYESIEDRRGIDFKIKPGDPKVKSSAGGGGRYNKAEADQAHRESAINNRRYREGKLPMPEFPKIDNKTDSAEPPGKVDKKWADSKIPMPKFPETDSKTAPVPPKLPKPEPAPKTNQKPAVVPDEPYDQAKVDKRREDILKKADEIVKNKTKELTTPDVDTKATESGKKKYMTSVRPNDALPPSTTRYAPSDADLDKMFK